LLAAEGETNCAGVQAFLANVRKLTIEKRLLRYLYLGEKK
jgi:hypothetical protein